MVTADPHHATKPDLLSEDERPPWQRARELLDAGYPWDEIKLCMRADYRARITFAHLLDDEDMAWLADVDCYGTISKIEGTYVDEDEMIAQLEELDRRDGLPWFDYRSV